MSGQTQHVILEGGPWDGTTMGWAGGEEIDMPDKSEHLGPIGSAPEGPRLIIHVYRRAMYRRRTFTYQGVRP